MPAGYEDLLKPEYKGLVIMPNPKSSGTGYMFVKALVVSMGEEEALAYFDQLNENIIEYTSSGSGPINRLIQKEAAIGLGMTSQAVNANQEGGDFEIQNIRFTGDPRVEKQYGFWSKIGRFMFGEKDKDFDSVDLLSEMKTDTWIPLISHLTDNGRFKEEDFQADIEKLRKFYRDHGYLDVEIDDSKIKFEFPDEDAPGDMDIVINIVPNHQYKVGKVSFKGNTLEGFSDSELMKFVDYFDLTEGNVFSPSKVDKLIEQIREYYGQYGYIDTIVRVLRRPNVNTDNIDLIIDIIESKMFYLESINIQGNDKTKSEVIIREIAMEPGAIFDLRRMKISENRLKETRFFDEVTLSAAQKSENSGKGGTYGQPYFWSWIQHG